MSLRKQLDSLSGTGGQTRAETIQYHELFKGEASQPAASIATQGNFLPGLRTVEREVEAYFKDVFAGSVF